MLDCRIGAEESVARIIERGRGWRIGRVLCEDARVEQCCVGPMVVDCSTKTVFLVWTK